MELKSWSSELGSLLICYRAGCQSALEMGRLFPDHTRYSRLTSSDGLCLSFWEYSSRTASMRRKWSILLVEMCAVAFWKSCTFIMTYEYCLILCKIESGQCSVLAVVTMLPNLQKLCFSLHSRVEMLYWRAQRGLQSLLQWLLPKSPLPLEQQRSNDVKLLLNYRWKVP